MTVLGREQQSALREYAGLLTTCDGAAKTALTAGRNRCTLSAPDADAPVADRLRPARHHRIRLRVSIDAAESACTSTSAVTVPITGAATVPVSREPCARGAGRPRVVLLGLVQRPHHRQWDRLRQQPSRRRASDVPVDRKSTRLNSSHSQISYAVFCLKKKKTTQKHT